MFDTQKQMLDGVSLKHWSDLLRSQYQLNVTLIEGCEIEIQARSRSLGHSVSHRCCRLLFLWLRGLRTEKSVCCISLFARWSTSSCSLLCSVKYHSSRRCLRHVRAQTACRHTACGQQSAIFCTMLSGCVHSSMCEPTRLQCYDEAFSCLDLNKPEAPLIYTFLS